MKHSLSSDSQFRVELLTTRVRVSVELRLSLMDNKELPQMIKELISLMKSPLVAISLKVFHNTTSLTLLTLIFSLIVELSKT